MKPQGKLAEVQQLLEEGARDGIFPWGRAEVWHRGHRVFAGGVGPEDALFDLASLTKVLCTGTLFAVLWGEGAVTPELPVSHFVPATPLPGVTLEDLLTHRSGLPAFRPFFAPVLRRWPELLDPQCPESLRRTARIQMMDDVFQTPPEKPRGEAAVYSDVGFMQLGELLARVGQQPMDQLYLARIAKPLQLGIHYRPLGEAPAETAPIAPTGKLRPREPALHQANDWSDISAVPSPIGEVDDDNAWALEGVSGHAGLFGTAHDVAHFGALLLDELAGKHRLAPRALWERMVTRDAVTPHSTRALAFDTPAHKGSSAGELMGNQPPGAFGHLGFTGTSLWVDRARQLSVSLCTNRVASGRAENRILHFRPRFHDAVVRGLGLEKHHGH